MTEKVSLLIDGELALAEIDSVIEHLASCSLCRQAQKDFLRLRKQLAAYDDQPDPLTQQHALRKILAAPAPLWRRTIALPAPVFALLLFALVALSVWLIALRSGQPTAPPVNRQSPLARTPADATPSPSVLDLSRFDRGERAVVYAAKRAAQ